MSESHASPQDNTDGLLSPTTSNSAGAGIGPGRKAGPSNDKKRKAGISSRGVANLTPEQLAKKRANDREAQRAIRERTKAQIETLEAKIRDLTSQQPYQDLQHIIRQKELVELENVEIKRRLAAVLELIQPILSGNLLAEAQRSSVEAILNHSPVNGYSSHTGSTQETVIPGLVLGGSSTARSSPASWHLPPPPTQIPADSMIRRTSVSSIKRGPLTGISSLLSTSSEDRRDQGLHALSRPDLVGHPQSLDAIPSPIIHTSPPADHHITLTPPAMQSPRQERDTRPQWESIPPWCAASNVFDGLILDFTMKARRQRSQGISDFELIGPAYPNFAAITYPAHDVPCHPMSRFLKDILAPFPDVTIVANKVGIAYMMFLVLRWHICPTQENYERLPLWARPNSWQNTIPHAIWIDHVPWPEMRTEMVRNPHRYPFDRFFVPHTKTESCNWDHGEAAMYASPGNNMEGEQILSHAFETHIRDIDNWTLGPQFAKEFPVLATTCRISTRGEEERRDFAEMKARATRQQNSSIA